MEEPETQIDNEHVSCKPLREAVSTVQTEIQNTLAECNQHSPKEAPFQRALSDIRLKSSRIDLVEYVTKKYGDTAPSDVVEFGLAILRGEHDGLCDKHHEFAMEQKRNATKHNAEVMAESVKEPSERHDSHNELCQRCGSRGIDRRTLRMDCFYDMSEMNVPFQEQVFYCPEGDVTLKSEAKPYGPFRYDGDLHSCTFYYLRVCKRCRAEWMQAIQHWFDREALHEDLDSIW